MEKFTPLATNFTLPPGLTGWTNFTSAYILSKSMTKLKRWYKNLMIRFKVANFVKQKKRIASSAKQAASKAGECS